VGPYTRNNGDKEEIYNIIYSFFVVNLLCHHFYFLFSLIYCYFYFLILSAGIPINATLLPALPGFELTAGIEMEYSEDTDFYCAGSTTSKPVCQLYGNSVVSSLSTPALFHCAESRPLLTGMHY
jgi:hypothetical protein